MKVVSFAFLGVLALALSSCGSGTTLSHVSVQPSKPAQGTRVMGDLQLGENDTGISAQGSVIDEHNGAVGVEYIGKTVNDNLATGTRYIDYSYRIQNNTTQAWTNTTCVLHYINGSSLANTLYRNVKNAARDLITDPTIIRSISESRPTFNNGSNIVFRDTESGYQIMTPAESRQVQQDALAVGMIQSQDIVLSTGYRLIGENQPWVIQPGQWGKLSFASQTPIRDAATTPLILGSRCVLFQQATTRVTRAPDETTASAATRANAVGATELMLTGYDTDVAPAPLTTVRNQNPIIYLPDPAVPDITIGSPIATLGSSVDFDASESTGEGLSYLWNFGDGTTSTDAFASHKYATRGTYTATVTVTDQVGRVTSKTTQVSVLPAMRDIPVQSAISQGFTASFDAGDPIPGLTYDWTFGDTSNGTVSNVGSGSRIAHTYPQIGTYNVELIIRDTRPESQNISSLSSGTSNKTLVQSQASTAPVIFRRQTFVTIWRKAPIAKFTASVGGVANAPVGKVPLTVSFDATSSIDPNSPPTNLIYLWDFGDGSNPAFGDQWDHVYTTPGVYLVTLTARNNVGLISQYHTFVHARSIYANTTFKFNYPTILTTGINSNISAQELNVMDRQEYEKQSKFSVKSIGRLLPRAGQELANQTFPYVINKAAGAPRGNFFPLNSAGQQVQTFCDSLKLFVNGNIRADGANQPLPIEIGGDDFPPEDGSLRYCRYIAFFPATIGTLPVRVFNDVLISTATYLSNDRFYVFDSVRVPKVAIAILPDEFLPGDVAGPMTQEYQAVNPLTNKTDYFMRVLIRKSEAANNNITFKVPVLAVDSQGKFMQTVSGVFNAAFTNPGIGASSDCGECLMINGKAYMNVTLSTNTFALSNSQLNLDAITMYGGDLGCHADTSPFSLAAKGLLSGCVSVPTSSEFPTANAPTTGVFKFPEILRESATFFGHVVYGDQAQAVYKFREYMSTGFYEDGKEFLLDSIPLYGNYRVCSRQLEYYYGGGAVTFENVAGTAFGCLGLAAEGGFVVARATTLAKGANETLHTSGVGAVPGKLSNEIKSKMQTFITQRLDGPATYAAVDAKMGAILEGTKECGQICVQKSEANVGRLESKGYTTQNAIIETEKQMKQAKEDGFTSGKVQTKVAEDRIICLTNSFEGSTLVRTSSGFTPIAQLFDNFNSSSGSPLQVWSFNEITQANELNTIARVYRNNDPEITTLTIKLSNGETETLTTTPEHPFYVNRFVDKSIRTKPEGHPDLSSYWIGAGHLKIGDQLKTLEGKLATVAYVNTLANTRVMYNLEVSRAHTFFVGGANYLVHNCSPFALKALWDQFLLHPYFDRTNFDSILKILAGIRSNDNLNGFIGGHSLNSVLSNVREYGSRITHTNGVIEIRPLAGASPTGGAASIYFTDYTNTVFWKKGTHTYFPAHLSDAEILSEIVSAFQHQTSNGVQSWEGVSSNGLKIAGSIDGTTGLINSAFPVP